MPSDMTTIKVRRATKARLVAVAESILAAAADGKDPLKRAPKEYNHPGYVGMSMDEVITLLLDARDALKARQRKSKARKRGKGDAKDHQCS